MSTDSPPIFAIKSIIGHNPDVPILNLTTDARQTTIAFASGNLAAIYNCHTLTTEYFQCHEKQIVGLACTCDGRFFVTFDADVCIIWDRDRRTNPTPTAIRHLRFNHADPSMSPADPIICAAISLDAKYLIVATANEMEFWIWSAFHVAPNAHYAFPAVFNGLKTIRFHGIHTNLFVCTLRDGVCFFEWKNGQLQVHVPSKSKSTKNLNDSTFMDNRYRTCYSISEGGNGIIWRDTTIKNQQFSLFNLEQFKVMKLCNQPALSITSSDGLLLITFQDGSLRFYGFQLRIIFWTNHFHRDLVRSVAFDQCPRKYRFCAYDERYEFGKVEEDGTELYLLENVPTHATVEQQPFMTRKFVVATKNGQIIDCDLLRRHTFRSIRFAASERILTFCLHPKLPLVCSGGENGRIVMYDYHDHVTLVDKNMADYRQLFPSAHESGAAFDSNEVSVLTYMPNGHHILCAFGNGFLYMLDPVTLNVMNRKALRFTYSKICDLVISSDCTLLAYHDVAMDIILCHFENGQWILLGKHFVHLLPIVCLNFVCGNTKLISCSEDRHCAVYDVIGSVRDDGSGTRRLELLESFRIEEQMQTTCGIQFGENVVLTSSTKYDYKLLDFNDNAAYFSQTTRCQLGEGYVSGMLLIGSAEARKCDGKSFLVFCTMEQKMGIQLLPLDGNPFKSTVMTAHPRSIIKLAKLNDGGDGNTIITLGEGDHSLCIWSVCVEPAMRRFHSGGTGLSPYCTLILGGSEGWLFKEMQDLYFYFHILCRHQDDEELVVAENISMLAVGDFMRAVGYFITTFAELAILKELTNNRPEEAVVEKVSFETLVKLYCNHRPIFKIGLGAVEAAFMRCARNAIGVSDECLSRRYPIKRNMTLARKYLIESMATIGQNIDRLDLARYLCILWNYDDCDHTSEESLLANTPEVFSLKEFMDNVMGLEMSNDGKCKYFGVEDPSTINPKLVNDTAARSNYSNSYFQ